MRRSRFLEEQIAMALRQAEAGTPVASMSEIGADVTGEGRISSRG